MSKIVLCAMPKSGSSFLAAYLRVGLGLTEDAPRRPAGAFPGCRLDDSYAREIRNRESFVWQVHFLPTPHNLRVLAAGGADRVVVHLRDPRQAALSWAHHAFKLRVSSYGQDDAFYARPFEEQVAAALRDHFPIICDWAAQWLREAERQVHVRALVTDYDELHSGKAALGRRVCEFYGARFDARAARSTPLGKFYRKGEREEWRRDFTFEQRAWCQAQLDAWGLGDRWSRDGE